MRRINVLHIISTLEIGGAEILLANLVSNLDSKNYASTVCCIARGGPLATELEKSGVKVVVLRQRNKFDPRVLLPLYRIMNEERIDIVHTHMFRANLWGRTAALLAGVPVIIASKHGFNLWKNFIHITVNRILAEFTDRIIVPSEFLRKVRIQREHIKPEDLVVIHNCIDLHTFDETIHPHNRRQEYGIKENERVIGVVCRLHEVKGIKYLIESLVELRNAIQNLKLLIVGDGPLKTNLINLAQKLGLGEQVIFAGYRRDIPEMLNTMDVFVLPSLREDFSLSIMEAMAMRKPVVATNVGAIPEVVVDGETAILVPPRDASALAKAISQILLDEQLAQKMGLAGRQRVKKQFSADAASARIQQLYSRLMRKKGGENIRGI